MPIRIPDALPAVSALERENIFVMTEHRALHQDIRPLKVLLLNLMPTKVATETQIMRKLANTPLQVEIDLLRMTSRESRHVSAAHLEAFYHTFDEVERNRYDGLIVTGAPVEQLPFEQVDYWDELCRVLDWSAAHVHSCLFICWGAQAALWHFYGIPKHDLPRKCFGVFEQRLLKPTSPLVRGFGDVSWMPHSRHTGTALADIEADARLEPIALSDEAGLALAKSTDSRHFFAFGHPEYDRGALRDEYVRDRAAGLDIALPAHYFPDDDPAREPVVRWRAEAQLLYSNWLNYYVYQTTPYDLRDL